MFTILLSTFDGESYGCWITGDWDCVWQVAFVHDVVIRPVQYWNHNFDHEWAFQQLFS